MCVMAAVLRPVFYIMLYVTRTSKSGHDMRASFHRQARDRHPLKGEKSVLERRMVLAWLRTALSQLSLSCTLSCLSTYICVACRGLQPAHMLAETIAALY